MADTITLTGNGDPSDASYAILLTAAEASITSYGDDEQVRTEIPLSGVDYTDNVLDADDIDCGYIVTGTCKYIDVFDSADTKLFRWTLETAIDLADTDGYLFNWPAGGVEFPTVEAPTVATGAVTAITTTTCTVAGTITDDGGGTISEYGVCWATSTNPTTSDNKVESSNFNSESGGFTAAINGLSGNTVYHVRAYAINEEGTSYGADVLFSTSSVSGGLGIEFGFEFDMGCGGGSSVTPDRWFVEVDKTTTDKTDTEVITATIQRTFLGAETIRLTVTGGKEAGEDYGIGANYTGSGTWVNSAYETNYTVISFGAGEQTKTVTLTIINNTVIEPDRTLTLTLTNASAGTVIGGAKTVTIVDDTRETIVSLTEEDDLAAAVAAARSAGEHTLISLAAGTYRADTVTLGASLTKGISIVGAGVDSTIVKRTADFHLRTTGEEEHIFTGTGLNNASNSYPVALSGFTIDGDQPTQGIKALWNKSYTILEGQYISFIGEDLDDPDTEITTKFTWMATPSADDITSSHRYYYVALGASSDAAWTNFINKLTAIGLEFYPNDDATYRRVMIETGQTWINQQNPISSPNNTSSEIEILNTQGSSLVYIIGNSGNQGRYDIRCDNLKLMNNEPSDGIQTCKNTLSRIYHISEDATDICGRGVYTHTGGWSDTKVKDLTGWFLHYELDSTGYTDGTSAWKVAYDIRDVYVNVLNLSSYGTSDVKFHPSTTIYGNNINVSDNWFITPVSATTLPTAEFIFDDCSFSLNRVNTQDMIFRPGKMKFRNCVFTARDITDTVANCVVVSFRGDGSSNPTSQYVKFQGCQFIQDNVNVTTMVGIGNGYPGGAVTENHKIYLETYNDIPCTFTGGTFLACIGQTKFEAGRGNQFIITGANTTNCQYIAELAYYDVDRPWGFSLDGSDCVFGHTLGMVRCTGQIANTTNYIHCQDCDLTYTQSLIDTDIMAWATALARFDQRRVDLQTGVMRTIQQNAGAGADPTTATQGLKKTNADTTIAYDEYYTNHTPAHHKYCTAEGASTTWSDTPPAS